ncbi:hypothetical protein LTR47_006090 [Exophiala xenobiotica]|nr:hypothetical protein LTR41_007851 [Exophiala xenobiotica]KAK5217513.1 hypothetical protein LTR72_009630 [Exophiala xenobiotica]KAK5232863.1 hypothetical protein LTR47_006090 [Exophiala xenobiotica]KAK5255399.1 hypothetical protein LTS06_000420 [Exophiala xenobiotica]KAK5287954.1 hypothetical protein LTR14_008737 [Exophiala xenobiotica]
MPKRKSYHKIRGGCTTCKERKVRCSLERPICQNCERLSRPCIYAGAVHNQHNAQASPSQGIPEIIRTQELELMHYYTAYTYRTMSDNPVLVSLWKEVVPKHAFQHPFLLQGLLAIAAHHRLQHDKKTSNSVDLIETANLYQQEALASYIRLLSEITEDNCHALFAFSQVIVGIQYSRLSLGIYPDTRTRHSQGVIAGMVEIFDLLKGALAIATQAQTWLRAGDLEPMMGDAPKTPPAETIPASTGPPSIKALSALSEHIACQVGVDEDSITRVSTLLSTVQFLRAAFLEDRSSVDTWNKIAGIPVFFDTNYLRLLKARDEGALVLLAYYGVALHQLGHVLFTDDVGAKVVQAVADTVGQDWSTYLVWPQMEVRARG